MQKKVAALTLGCKVNDYDTAVMLNQFQSNGYEIENNFYSYADIYLINTCTVTSLGDKKSRQMIRRAKVSNPNAIVIAAGCYSQVAPNEVAQIEGVNIVLGNNDRNSIVNIVENYTHKGTVIHTTDLRYEKIFEEMELQSMGTKTRAFVKIQEGCNEFCSYCIIPYSRGKSRSREVSNIVKEVSHLASNGYKEIVITGIHVASYGKDLTNTNLLDVIKKIHEIKGVERIRLSSIEPNIITKDFVTNISTLNKVCDHFHLSLQSGCDKTLKSMNRKYTITDFKNAVYLLRSYLPNVAVTTDIIAGFPGEEERDFAQTLAFVEDIGFASMHIFPFSAKEGTRAYNFPDQIPTRIKNARVGILKEIDANQRKQFITNMIGTNLSVLYETQISNNIYEGYSSNYIKILTESKKDLKNKVENIYIEKEKDGCGISCNIH